MRRDAFIKTVIEKPNKRVRLEFEVSGDWQPSEPGCWVDCPFSICTEFGKECRASKADLCPFKKYLVKE